MAGIWILICQAMTRKAHTIHTVSTLLRTLHPEGFDSYEDYTFLILPPLFAYLPIARVSPSWTCTVQPQSAYAGALAMPSRQLRISNAISMRRLWMSHRYRPIIASYTSDRARSETQRFTVAPSALYLWLPLVRANFGTVDS